MAHYGLGRTRLKTSVDLLTDSRYDGWRLCGGWLSIQPLGSQLEFGFD